MSQKIIITTLAIFFIASSAYLSSSEAKGHQIKSQWFLFFNSPKSESLSFTIENHTDKSNFDYTVYCQNQKLEEGKVKISSGKSATINPKKADCSGKIIVEAKTEKESQRVYKISNLR